jgi:hypothetical protein
MIRGTAHEPDLEHESSVMSVERCAQLIISAMQGRPSVLFHESWIAKQPTLAFLYLNQYLPSLATFILGYLGRWRKKAWEMGLPMYKVSSWVQAAKSEKHPLQNNTDNHHANTVSPKDK